MTEELFDYRRDPADGREALRASMPTPEMNAPAIVYLLSEAAAGISGQVLRVDGNELSLMSHPLVLAPATARGPVWTVQEVAAALAGPLAGDRQPLGIVRA
jgi:hypothetical protein